MSPFQVLFRIVSAWHNLSPSPPLSFSLSLFLSPPSSHLSPTSLSGPPFLLSHSVGLNVDPNPIIFCYAQLFLKSVDSFVKKQLNHEICSCWCYTNYACVVLWKLLAWLRYNVKPIWMCLTVDGGISKGPKTQPTKQQRQQNPSKSSYNVHNGQYTHTHTYTTWTNFYFHV